MKKTLLAIASASTLFMSMAMPVSAQGSVNSDVGIQAVSYTSASVSGASATGNITFYSSTKATPVNESVKDTLCDSNDVYVHWRVYDRYNRYSFNTYNQRDSSGCNTSGQWSNLNITSNNGIGYVRLEVCVDDFGSDTCSYGPAIYNPYN